ncbi:hypothetical protein A2188_02640 [Candidatus Woesebacteria bacterium RIFOXYA1_FULL_43_9]|uniref:Adenylate kinase n=1 Tax=Candidatus Woesebacteria bacterium RIFOXYA1_FULL_43_9 TaxID=1802534 RepID=A0A1F8CLM9_9BACT|nr:MAG: hypothetical protein A2188_02640 [Candidatus Woesebacteria bacterium RIFOXYA1_FULL_43_9]
MSYTFLGPQGSGKGTQADILAEKIGYVHISSGEILREMAKTSGEIKKMLEEGAIVPDEDTLGYIDEYVQKHGYDFDKVIFDGYPRKVNQYVLLKNFLAQKGKSLEKVVYLSLSDESAVSRLSSRLTCRVCGKVYNTITNPPQELGKCECGGELFQREDDNPIAIGKRLAVYHENTIPVLELARKDGLLLEVDGEQSIEKIASDLETALKISK